jgi:hypothetical protein
MLELEERMLKLQGGLFHNIGNVEYLYVQPLIV